jgi:polysaccharide biosynthesis/export protein
MKKTTGNHLLLFFLLLVFMVSCSPLKDIHYLQQKSDGKVTADSLNVSAEYKLKAKDVVYIKILSTNEKAYVFFNADATAPNATSSDLSVYLNSYTINDSGFVFLPIIGKVLLAEKTVEQAREKLQIETEKYLKDATVICKMINFKITILGEVNKPGLYKVYDTKINLFDAIGLAGDLTVFGNRRTIMIVRANDDGSNSVINVDITNRKIINSAEYLLKPNDIVYIPALRTKTLGFGTFPFATVLTAITTFILVLNYMK